MGSIGGFCDGAMASFDCGAISFGGFGGGAMASKQKKSLQKLADDDCDGSAMESSGSEFKMSYKAKKKPPKKCAMPKTESNDNC